MRLSVNGQNRESPELINILELLETLELNPERVVVELNRDILTADRYADTRLRDGDTLELIQFVGGG